MKPGYMLNVLEYQQTLTAAQIKALVFEAKEGLKWR